MTLPSPAVLGAADRERLAEVGALAARGPAGVDGLIERLADPNWVVRRAVVAALAASGDAAVAPLCAALRERRDDEARIAATVDALVASTGAVPAAIAALLAEGEEPAIVADAAQVAGRRRSIASVAALGRLVAHADDNVVVAAIEALGRIGGDSALGAVVAASESGNFFRTFPAIDVLGRSGAPLAVAPLARLVDEPLYAHEAARALGRTGQAAAAAPLLATLAREGDALLRVVASALVDLVHRQRERAGTAEAVERAMRSLGAREAVVRRLARAVTGADGSEQAALCRVLGWIGGDAAVGCLLDLIDGEPGAAAPAAAALGALGAGATDRLRAALRDGDSGRRLLLLPMVLDVPAAAPEVLRCLEDPEGSVRALACAALSRVGGPAALDALFECLGDPEPRVSQAAVSAIDSIGGPETEARVLAAVRSGDPSTRLGALLILAHGGFASGLPELVDATADPDERVREAAIHGVARFDDAAARDALLAAAEHPSDRARAAAMRGLWRPARDARALPALRRGLGDRNAWVRYYACQSLGRLGDAAATDALAVAVSDPAGQVRIAAVEALAHLRSDAARRMLREAASSGEPEVQRAALRGVGAAGLADGLPMVLAAADAPDALTRLVAVAALEPFDEPGVLDALRLAADDRDERVRGAALDALAARPGAEASAALVALLARPAARERAARALERPAAGRVTALVAALATAEDEVGEAIVEALVRLLDAGAEGVVEGVLGLPDAVARRSFAAALARRDTPQARAALDLLAASDADPEVRRIAAPAASITGGAAAPPAAQE